MTKQDYLNKAFDNYEEAMSWKRKHEYLLSIPETTVVPNKEHWLRRTQFNYECCMAEYNKYKRKAIKCA